MKTYLKLITVLIFLSLKTVYGQALGMGYINHYFHNQELSQSSGIVTIIRLPIINGFIYGLNIINETINSKFNSDRGSLMDTQFVFELPLNNFAAFSGAIGHPSFGGDFIGVSEPTISSQIDLKFIPLSAKVTSGVNTSLVMFVGETIMNAPGLRFEGKGSGELGVINATNLFFAIIVEH